MGVTLGVVLWACLLLQVCTSQFYGGGGGRGNRCTTGSGQEGQCIPAKQCTAVDAMFKANRGNSLQISYLVSEYGCGFRQNVPYLCCTEQEASQPSWTPPVWQTTPTPTRPKNTPPPRRTSPRPSFTSTARPQTTRKWNSGMRYNHQNRHLLPEVDCGTMLSESILGGVDAGISEFPWVAQLQYSFPSGRTFIGCGGSLISPQYVLTAAHCIKSSSMPRNVKISKIRFGEWDTTKDRDCDKSGVCSPPVQDIEVEDIITHKDYKPNDLAQYNDIALIRLRRNVSDTNYVRPICLPLDSLLNKNYQGKELTAAGWGKTTNVAGSESTIKQKISMPFVDVQMCSPFYTKNQIKLKDTQMCAGGKKNEDTCQGDSGGPLMSTDRVEGSSKRWYVDGIVSFGPELCGKQDIPGIYTKVSKYVGWIMDNMKP